VRTITLPFWFANPYHEGEMSAPEMVFLPDLAELPADDPRAAHLPAHRDPSIGLGGALCAHLAEATGDDNWVDGTDRRLALVEGAYLLPDGRPALVYGPTAFPDVDLN
jgi:hypothetical protein